MDVTERNVYALGNSQRDAFINLYDKKDCHGDSN